MKKPVFEEKRRARRYPLKLEITYSLLRSQVRQTLKTRTVNMSTNGVLIFKRSEASFSNGDVIELQIQTASNPEMAVYLCGIGTVVRSEKSRLAVELGQLHFRREEKKIALSAN